MANRPNGCVLVTKDGEAFTFKRAKDLPPEAGEVLPLLLNRRLFADLRVPALDVLELFAFTCPAVSLTPAVKPLCRYLSLPEPEDAFAEAESLFAITEALFKRLRELPAAEQETATALAKAMQDKGGWLWGGMILDTLGRSKDITFTLTGYNAWEKLSEWEELPPPPPAGSQPISAKETEERLHNLTRLIASAEERPEQVSYAKAAAKAFAPRQKEKEPQVVLAQAGTGVGKTLAYIAAASVWAHKNAGSVWLSTYTKNLQRQLDTELSKLFPDQESKKRNVVIRKGRENYICLLNYAEAVSRISTSLTNTAVPLGMVARWLSHTRDGDLNDGDFPGWLYDLMGSKSIKSLSDRRRECVYQQCPYFRKCFIEKNIRRSRRAKIVVANHALVMAEASGRLDDLNPPTRYVFDEAHHLFTAADSAFSAVISGFEGEDLRQWLTGSEDTSRLIRRRGLSRRAEEISLTEPDIVLNVNEALAKASFLPHSGWLSRIKGGKPAGETETFLTLVYQQVKARTSDLAKEDSYALECDVFPLSPELTDATAKLSAAVTSFCLPIKEIIRLLQNKLDTEIAEMDASDKQRCNSLIRSLQHRILETFSCWQQMLDSLLSGTTSAEEIMWFSVEKLSGQEVDVTFQRHFIDPMKPFAAIMAPAAHGILITSATLKEQTENPKQDWEKAALHTGATYLNPTPETTDIASPFNYPEATKIFVVSDVNKNDSRSVAAAMRELFLASGGGALGLFTSIKRLQSVYALLKDPVAEAGINLLAQHIHDLNTATLLDIFREDENSCLLGTDAVRDGIDVPGHSLRLLVFDRVPWSRPDIAHKARRNAFGKDSYERMLVRKRLAQAYGRLIRKNTDKGALVILDRALPSNLENAFPAGVEINRINLKETVYMLKEWL